MCHLAASNPLVRRGWDRSDGYPFNDPVTYPQTLPSSTALRRSFVHDLLGLADLDGPAVLGLQLLGVVRAFAVGGSIGVLLGSTTCPSAHVVGLTVDDVAVLAGLLDGFVVVNRFFVSMPYGRRPVPSLCQPVYLVLLPETAPVPNFRPNGRLTYTTSPDLSARPACPLPYLTSQSSTSPLPIRQGSACPPLSRTLACSGPATFTLRITFRRRRLIDTVRSLTSQPASASMTFAIPLPPS